MGNISSVASKINEPDLSGEWELSSVGQAMTTEELYWSEAVHAALAGRELPELVELQFIRTVIDGALAYERALHDPRQLDAFFKAAGFRPKSIRHAAARSPHPRSARAPRRSRTAQGGRKVAVSSAGDGPPPEDPPRRRASQKGAPASVGALLVSDRTALAVSGLNPRQLRTLTRKIRIQHAKVGRRIPVRADVFLAALGLGGATPTAKPEPVRSDWRGRALRLIGGGR
jgi:hypothetical protein